MRRLGTDRRSASARLPIVQRTALASHLPARRDNGGCATTLGARLPAEETTIARAPLAVLTKDEEVTLRRVAYGQSDVRSMRRHDLARLQMLHLIEDRRDGPSLTVTGKQHFDGLPKAASLDASSRLESMLKAISPHTRRIRR